MFFDMIALNIVWQEYDLSCITDNLFQPTKGLYHYYGIKYMFDTYKVIPLKKWNNIILS